jgi:hypothetical protein
MGSHLHAKIRPADSGTLREIRKGPARDRADPDAGAVVGDLVPVASFEALPLRPVIRFDLLTGRPSADGRTRSRAVAYRFGMSRTKRVTKP